MTADGAAFSRTEAAFALARQRHAVRRRRRATDLIMATLFLGATALAAGLLVVVLGYVLVRGLPAITPEFFVERPLPYGETGGGVAPAILGTVVMAAVAAALAVPIGLGAAIFVVEYRYGRFAEAVRFAAELVAGLPSIVVGVFVWAFIVRDVIGNFAGLAGGIALAIIMIPIVARTVEEVLRLIPHSLREAAMALGAPKWRVILRVVLPTARAGIATGIVLAVARAAGETAPLLLTALGSVYFSTALLEPMAALPLQIYGYAVSPFDDWHTKAWGSSLVLVLVIGVMSLILRLVARKRF